MQAIAGDGVDASEAIVTAIEIRVLEVDAEHHGHGPEALMPRHVDGRHTLVNVVLVLLENPDVLGPRHDVEAATAQSYRCRPVDLRLAVRGEIRADVAKVVIIADRRVVDARRQARHPVALVLETPEPAILGAEGPRRQASVGNQLLELVEGKVAVVVVVLGQKGAAERIFHVGREMADFGLQEHTPLGHHARRHGGIEVGRKIQVVRRGDIGAVLVAVADGREEPSALALVRDRHSEARRPEHWHVIDFQARIGGNRVGLAFGNLDPASGDLPALVAGLAASELAFLDGQTRFRALKRICAAAIGAIVEHEFGALEARPVVREIDASRLSAQQHARLLHEHVTFERKRFVQRIVGRELGLHRTGTLLDHHPALEKRLGVDLVLTALGRKRDECRLGVGGERLFGPVKGLIATAAPHGRRGAQILGQRLPRYPGQSSHLLGLTKWPVRAIAIRGAIDNGGRRDRREGAGVNVDLTTLPLAVGARRAAPLALGQRAGKGGRRGERDRRREQTQGSYASNHRWGADLGRISRPIIREAGRARQPRQPRYHAQAPAMA